MRSATTNFAPGGSKTIRSCLHHCKLAYLHMPRNYWQQQRVMEFASFYHVHLHQHDFQARSSHIPKEKGTNIYSSRMLSINFVKHVS